MTVSRARREDIREPTLGPKRRGNGTRDFDAGMWRTTRVSYSFEIAEL